MPAPSPGVPAAGPELRAELADFDDRRSVRRKPAASRPKARRRDAPPRPLWFGSPPGMETRSPARCQLTAWDYSETRQRWLWRRPWRLVVSSRGNEGLSLPHPLIFDRHLCRRRPARAGGRRRTGDFLIERGRRICPISPRHCAAHFDWAVDLGTPSRSCGRCSRERQVGPSSPPTLCSPPQLGGRAGVGRRRRRVSRWPFGDGALDLVRVALALQFVHDSRGRLPGASALKADACSLAAWIGGDRGPICARPLRRRSVVSRTQSRLVSFPSPTSAIWARCFQRAACAAGDRRRPALTVRYGSVFALCTICRRMGAPNPA